MTPQNNKAPEPEATTQQETPASSGQPEESDSRLEDALQKATEAMASYETEGTEQQQAAQEAFSQDRSASVQDTQPAAEQPAQQQSDEASELRDQLLRAVAETENVRRRAQRDVEETRKYAVTGFARELVSVMDNLQRAAESIPPEARENDQNLKNLAAGVEMTLQELKNAFAKQGIEQVNPLHAPFDHNFHQAIMQIETAEHPPGTVVQVMQPGYTIKDRLLRPAMVGVAKAPASSGEQPSVDTEA
jgi:molecular chaperone GrpE